MTSRCCGLFFIFTQDWSLCFLMRPHCIVSKEKKVFCMHTSLTWERNDRKTLYSHWDRMSLSIVCVWSTFLCYSRIRKWCKKDVSVFLVIGESCVPERRLFISIASFIFIPRPIGSPWTLTSLQKPFLSSCLQGKQSWRNPPRKENRYKKKET